MAFNVELVEQDRDNGEVSRQVKITDHEGRVSYLDPEEAATLADDLWILTVTSDSCGNPDCTYCNPTEKE